MSELGFSHKYVTSHRYHPTPVPTLEEVIKERGVDSNPPRYQEKSKPSVLLPGAFSFYANTFPLDRLIENFIPRVDT